MNAIHGRPCFLLSFLPSTRNALLISLSIFTLSNFSSTGTVSGHLLQAGPSSGSHSIFPWLSLTTLSFQKCVPCWHMARTLHPHLGAPCWGVAGVHHITLILTWKNCFLSPSILHSPFWALLFLCPHGHYSKSSLSPYCGHNYPQGPSPQFDPSHLRRH